MMSINNVPRVFRKSSFQVIRMVSKVRARDVYKGPSERYYGDVILTSSGTGEIKLYADFIAQHSPRSCNSSEGEGGGGFQREIIFYIDLITKEITGEERVNNKARRNKGFKTITPFVLGKQVEDLIEEEFKIEGDLTKEKLIEKHLIWVDGLGEFADEVFAHRLHLLMGPWYRIEKNGSGWIRTDISEKERRAAFIAAAATSSSDSELSITKDCERVSEEEAERIYAALEWLAQEIKVDLATVTPCYKSSEEKRKDNNNMWSWIGYKF